MVYQVASLLLIPLLSAILCMIIRRSAIVEKIAVTGSLMTLAAGILVAYQIVSGNRIAYFDGYLSIDNLSMLMVVLITSIGAGAVFFSLSYMKEEIARGHFGEERIRWYYGFLHLFILAMLLSVTTDNLGIFWVAMELTTLTSALMISLYRSRASLEAAWKYVIICSAGIGLALFGTVLTYYSSVGITGTDGGTLNWSVLMREASNLNPSTIRLAFIFILIGYGTKAGLVPMHTWLPDAHSQAPTPVSGLLSGVLLSCAVYGIMRYNALVTSAIGKTYPGTFLIAFGLVSIVTAALFMLVQKDYKRLLAYSSIEHVGIVVFALGLGGKLALYGAVFHLINHAISKSTLFFIAGRINHIFRSKQIGRVRGIIGVSPVTGTLFIVGILAIAGSPPFGLFASEIIILSGGFASGKVAVSLLALLPIITAFGGLTYYLSRISFGPRTHRPVMHSQYRLPIVIFSAGLGAMLIVGLYIPSWLHSLLTDITRSLGGA